MNAIATPHTRNEVSTPTVPAWRNALPLMVGIIFSLASLWIFVLLLAWFIQYEPASPAPSLQVNVVKEVQSNPPPPPSPPSPPQALQTPPPPIHIPLPTMTMPVLDNSLTIPNMETLSLHSEWSPQQLDVPAPVTVAPLPIEAVNTDITESSGAQRQVNPDLTRHYPRRARRRGWAGRTVVELVIDRTGHVSEVTVIASTPKGVFDEAAKKASQDLRYKPAMQNGQPTSSRVREVFEWRLQK